MPESKIRKLFHSLILATAGVRRLLVITIGFASVAGMSLFAMRLVTQSQPAPKSPLASFKDGPLIFSRGNEDQAPLYSRAGFQSLQKLGPRVVAAVDVRSTVDRRWVVYGPESLAALTTATDHFEGKTAEEIAALRWKDSPAEGPMLLETYLSTFLPERLMLIVHSRDTGAVRNLADLFSSAPTQIFAYSPNHIINRALRQQLPKWNFGSDAAQMAQWHLFAALGLESMVSGDFDWLLQSPNGKITDRVRSEMTRREIPSVWTGDDAPPATTRLLGILTSRPTRALVLIKDSY